MEEDLGPESRRIFHLYTDPVPHNADEASRVADTLPGFAQGDLFSALSLRVRAANIREDVALAQDPALTIAERVALVGGMMRARLEAARIAEHAFELNEEWIHTVASTIGTAVAVAVGLLVPGAGVLAAAFLSTVAAGAARLMIEAMLSPDGRHGSRFRSEVLSLMIEVAVAAATAGLARGLVGELPAADREAIVERVRNARFQTLARLMNLEAPLAGRTPAVLADLANSGRLERVVANLLSEVFEASTQTIANAVIIGLAQGRTPEMPSLADGARIVGDTAGMHFATRGFHAVVAHRRRFADTVDGAPSSTRGAAVCRAIGAEASEASADVPVREVSRQQIEQLRAQREVLVLSDHGDALLVDSGGQAVVLVSPETHLDAGTGTHPFASALEAHTEPGTGGRMRGEQVVMEQLVPREAARWRVDITTGTGSGVDVHYNPTTRRVEAVVGARASVAEIRNHASEVDLRLREGHRVMNWLQRIDRRLSPPVASLRVLEPALDLHVDALERLFAPAEVEINPQRRTREREYLKHLSEEIALRNRVERARSSGDHEALARAETDLDAVWQMRQAYGDPNVSDDSLLLDPNTISRRRNRALTLDLQRLDPLEPTATPAEVDARAEAVFALMRTHDFTLRAIPDREAMVARYRKGLSVIYLSTSVL